MPRLLLLALVALLASGTGCHGSCSQTRPPLHRTEGGCKLPSTIHGTVLRALTKARAQDGQPATFVIARASEVEPFTYESTPLPEKYAGGDPGKTYADMTREDVFRSLDRLREDTWTSFLAANAETQDLSKVTRIAEPHTFVGERELRELFSGDTDEAYERLFERYPGTESLLSMSMPGVSADGNQAMLYVSLMRAGEDGTGHYFLLVRVGDTWKVETEVQVWIA